MKVFLVCTSLKELLIKNLQDVLSNSKWYAKAIPLLASSLLIRDKRVINAVKDITAVRGGIRKKDR